MKLSAYSDYSIRVLAYAALRHPARVTIAEVAETFGSSRNHLVKVVHDLGRAGYLATYRGVGGGFTLAQSPAEVRVGEVIRRGEEQDGMVDCREGDDHFCRMFPACRLKTVLDEAAAAFFAVLDRYTLAELIKPKSRMKAILGIANAPRRSRAIGVAPRDPATSGSPALRPRGPGSARPGDPRRSQGK
jgi:Rrf2 family nitric oxide-sensitive transcriptional repressor